MFGKAGIPDKPTPEEHADMLEETRRNIWAKRAIFNGKRAQEQSRTHFDPLEEVDDYVESGDEGIEDFGFGSESDEEELTEAQKVNLVKSALIKPRSESVHMKVDLVKSALIKPLQNCSASAPTVRPEKTNLACLMNQGSESPCANLCNVECNSSPGLCTNSHNDEFEKISIMIDSGASETVASEDRFPSYDLVKITASGITYSSAAESQAEDITNIGEQFVETVDENGVTSWAKFQICKGLSGGRILGSVSRLVQSNHTVVFRDPSLGSYIENNVNKYRSYLRQDNGSYFLDLYVKKATSFARQGS